MTLLIPECDACNQSHFPPRALCPFCGEGGFRERPAGQGRLVAATQLLRTAGQALAQPVTLGLVDADGVLIVARLMGEAPRDQAVLLRRAPDGAIFADVGPPPP